MTRHRAKCKHPTMSSDKILPTQYEHVAAGQTGQVMGSARADDRGQEHLARVIICPTSTSPGAVTITESSVSTVIFDGGSSSVATLAPITVELGIVSNSTAWSITTGTNVRAIGIGRFK